MRIRRYVLIACLEEYISRHNKDGRLTTDQLIITHRKPFKEASTDTMIRWIKDIFIVNNFVNFSPHIFFDKEITEYALEAIDFNRICKANNNV